MYLAAFIGIFSYFTFGRHGASFYIYLVILVVLVGLFLKNLLTNAYLSADGTVVSIKRDLRTTRIDQNKIIEINVQASPFSSSYFLLSDGQKIKFDGWSLSKKELEKLKEINPNVK